MESHANSTHQSRSRASTRSSSMSFTLGNMMTQEQKVYNLLQMYPNSHMILDLRSQEQFANVSLPNSINIPFTDYPTNEITADQIQAVLDSRQWRQRKRQFWILIHGETDLTYALKEVLKCDGCKEVHLVLNQQTFFQKYQKVLCQGVSYKHQLPSEILDGQLYLGSQKHAINPEVIHRLGITHIVNASRHIPNKFESDIKYMNVYVTDIESESIDTYFEEVYKFIHEAMNSENARVLVHCAFGVSRSATLVIMYLMKNFQISYEEAFEYTKQCREIVDPNEGFKNQLIKFEE